MWGYTWKIHPILYNSSALRMSSFYVVVFWERAATKCIEIYYAHAKLLLNCSLDSVSSGCHFHTVLNLKAQNSLNETPIYEKFVICNLFVNILTYHYFFSVFFQQPFTEADSTTSAFVPESFMINSGPFKALKVGNSAKCIASSKDGHLSLKSWKLDNPHPESIFVVSEIDWLTTETES